MAAPAFPNLQSYRQLFVLSAGRSTGLIPELLHIVCDYTLIEPNELNFRMPIPDGSVPAMSPGFYNNNGREDKDVHYPDRIMCCIAGTLWLQTRTREPYPNYRSAPLAAVLVAHPSYTAWGLCRFRWQRCYGALLIDPRELASGDLILQTFVERFDSPAFDRLANCYRGKMSGGCRCPESKQCSTADTRVEICRCKHCRRSSYPGPVKMRCWVCRTPVTSFDHPWTDLGAGKPLIPNHAEPDCFEQVLLCSTCHATLPGEYKPTT